LLNEVGRIEVLLMLLLLHDHTSHLLLHLDHCLRVQETIGEIQDILTLEEEGHQATLIRLCEVMQLDCINSQDFFFFVLMLVQTVH
jgi:hypothetical protein